MPLSVRNDPPWSQKIVKIWYIFSKQNFLRFVPMAEKVHFWQGCRTVFAIKQKNFRSNPETVEELKKNLTPIVFPRKDPLAPRVQFCKPCLRKFSRKWSWIFQNTKRTNRICTIFTKKIAGKRSLDTQEQYRQLWQSFPAGIQEIFHSKFGNVEQF